MLKEKERKKKKKVTAICEEHHRRQRSLDGKDNPGNISYVGGRDHKAWHVLVGNMNAYQIRDFINHLESKYKPANLKIACKFINGTKVIKKGGNNSHNTNKIDKAWDRIFGAMSFYDAIAYINSVWLDPAYHFYVRKAKNK